MNLPRFPFSRQALLLAVPLLAILIYAPSLGNGFAMIDDGLLIYENNLVREFSPRTWSVAFTSYDPELYIPLTFMSYQVDYLIGGYDPFIYHLTNLLLHAGSAFLLSLLIFLLTGKRSFAILIGFLFAIHPLHAEAVAWAAARKDVLSGFFFLASLTAYVFHARRTLGGSTSLPLLLSSVFLFLFALLAKVSVLSLPAILLLVDWYLGRRSPKRLFLEKIPFILLSLLFGIVALGGKSALIVERSPVETLLIAAKMTATAAVKIFLPLRLSVFYPELHDVAIFNPIYLVSIFSLLLIASLLWFFRKNKALLFGVLFFLITLSPSFFSVVKGGNTFFFSDRYAYLPSIGILFLVTPFLIDFLPRKLAKKISSPLLPVALTAVIVLAFIPMTVAQSLHWGDNVELFTQAVRHSPDFYLGHIDLGASLRAAGRKEEALAEFQKAVSLFPLANTYGLMGQVEAERGNYTEAIKRFEEGLKMMPDDPELLYGLGQVYALMGESDMALESYEHALASSPPEEDRYKQFARRISSRRDKIYLRMGILEGERGNHERAMELYELALRENPLNADVEYNLAVALSSMKRMDEAILHYESAISIDPLFIRARVNLGILYQRSGRTREAIDQFREILSIDPMNDVAQRALRSLGAAL